MFAYIHRTIRFNVTTVSAKSMNSIRLVHINKLIRHFHLNIYLGKNGPTLSTLLPEFWNIFKLRSMGQNWTTCSFVSLVNCWHHQKIYIFPGRSYLLYKDLTRDILFNWGLQFVSLWFLAENQKSHSSNVIFGVGFCYHKLSIITMEIHY